MSKPSLSGVGSDVFSQYLPLSLMCSAPEGPLGQKRQPCEEQVALAAALTICLPLYGVNRVEQPGDNLSGPLS